MDDPKPLDLTGPPGSPNRIHALLDEIGLPWRETRGSLAQRFGVVGHPAYPWNVVEVPTSRPLTDGMLWPLSAQDRDEFAPALPAIRFTTHAWFDDDAEGNLEGAATPIAARLGAAPMGPRHNTARCEWLAGPAALRLRVWPPDRQSFDLPNSSHRRDPRLVTACLVEIETGFRPPLAPSERASLSDFVPMVATGDSRIHSAGEVAAGRPQEAWLEFAREPPANLGHVSGWAGRSRAADALIVCRDQLYVVPTQHVAGFEVTRLLQGRGGSGAHLSAVCRADASRKPLKRLPLAQAAETFDLDEAGAAFADAFGVECTLFEPFPNS